MATSSFFHDMNIDTPEKTQSFIEALEKAEAIDNDLRRKKYEIDLLNRGCGYFSVCDEAGFACPCSSDSKVKQGYDPQVWDSLKRSLDKAIAEMESESFDFGIADDYENDDDFDWRDDIDDDE